MQWRERARRLGAPARLFVVLASLLYPWPSLGEHCSALFVNLGNAAASVAFRSAAAQLSFAPMAADRQWRTRMVVKNAASGAVVHTGALQLRRVWYVPMAVFLALAAAIRLPGRWRPTMLMLGGLCVLQAPAALTVLAFLLRMDALHADPWLKASLEVAYRVFDTAPGMAFAVPGMLWLFAMTWTGAYVPPFLVARRQAKPERKRGLPTP